LSGISVDLLLCKVTEFDAISTIYLLPNGIDFLLNGKVEVIQELEIRFPFANCDDSFSQVLCASTALGPMVADDGSVSTCR